MALKILIVDDHAPNIASLVEALDSAEIEFVSAASGQEALQTLLRHDDFDLALLDVQMPGMDGYELASLMRGVARTKHIPIVFITAQLPSASSRFKGYDVGAIDFIFKPIDVPMLRSKVDVFRRLKVKRLDLAAKVRELEAAKEKLEISERRATEADLLKSAFLAHMSHEIRTPITALIGFAELLKPIVSHHSEGEKYIDIILRNGQHLLGLVNGILDLSKVEAGQLEIQSEPTELVAIVEDVLALMEPVAHDNRVDLRFERPSRPRVDCQTDPLRLKQILTNVIGNAVKFSPEGVVSLHLEVDESRQQAVFAVRDSGPGIDVSQRDRLFRPFSQIHGTGPSREHQGTGLGLSLSRQLARLLGGDVELRDSEPGRGSVFVVRVAGLDARIEPDQSVSPPQAIALGADTLAGLHVLLADDSPDNRMLIEVGLRQYGASIESVENGKEAIERIHHFEPDLVLMDFKMPVMDGLTATRALRERGFMKPIILLTANAMKGEHETALRAGASDYVSKPIDWQRLIGAIRAVADAPREEGRIQTLTVSEGREDRP